MNQILEWPPIVWAVRIALLIVGLVGLYLFLLLMARATRMIVRLNREMDRFLDVAESLRRATRVLKAETNPGTEWRAKPDFYNSLIEQYERAKQGVAMLPEVPPVGELTLVDGFLMWKGRPVWWSGYTPQRA